MVVRFSSGGETTSISETWSGIINSSKVKRTSFPLKFNDLYPGCVPIKTGGMESFGPPVGIPWLAHDETITIQANPATMIYGNLSSIFILFKNDPQTYKFLQTMQVRGC